MTGQQINPELMLAATRGPQVESLADAYARMAAQDQARKLGKQALTLGDINLQRERQAQSDDAAMRQTVIRNAGLQQPQQQMPPAAPPTEQVQQLAPASAAAAPVQTQAPAQNQAPAPAAPMNQFEMADRNIADLRRQGLYKQADAMAAASLKQRLDIAAASKDAAQAANDNASADQKKNAAMYQATSFLSQVPPEQRAAVWPQVRDHMVQAGYIHGDHAMLDYPGDQWLQTEHEITGSQADKDAAAKAKRDAELAAPQLAEQKAKADFATRQNAAAQLAQAARQGPDAVAALRDQMPYAIAKQFEGATKPEDFLRIGQTPSEAVTSAATAARDANTVTNDKAMRDQGAKRLSIENDRLKLEREKAGFDMSGGISPAAQMAADGRMDPLTVRAMIRKTPGLLGQIKTVDPNFDEANVENRYNTLKEFTSTSNTKAGGQAIALNTLVHHADLYLQAAEALKNGSFVPGNRVYNAVAQAFGSAPPTNAALVARFFAGETGKVATGGVPAEGEINGILKNLSTSAGPDQIAGAGKTLLSIAAGRATPLMERVKQAKLDNVVQVLGPDAQEILSRRGFDPKTMKPTAAAPASTAAAPGKYTQTATGPNNHKIGSNDGGATWFDVQTGQKVQ